MDHDATADASSLAVSVPETVLGDDAVGLDRSAFDNPVAEIGREDSLQTFALFFEETEARFCRLRALSCEKQRQAVEREAHGLKGSGGNFGFRRLSQLAGRLERDARTITAADYEAALGAMETSYAAARHRFDNI